MEEGWWQKQYIVNGGGDVTADPMVIVCDVTGIGHQISFKNKVMKPKNVIPYPASSSSLKLLDNCW